MNPARFAVCQTKSERVTSLLSMARASRVRKMHMRMHEHTAHRRGNGNLLHARMIDAHGQHQAAEQARRDVIEVRRAAGDDLPLHGELEQLQARHGLLEQCVGGHHGRHGGCRRAAHAGRQRDALFDVYLEAISELRGPHASPGPRARRCCSAARPKISSATPLMERIRTTGSSIRRTPHPIAHRLYRMAQDVEADADVGDGGWRESGYVGWHGTSSVRFALKMRAEIRGQAQQVGEHAAGRDFRTGSRDPARSADCRNSGESRIAPHCR